MQTNKKAPMAEPVFVHNRDTEREKFESNLYLKEFSKVSVFGESFSFSCISLECKIDLDLPLRCVLYRSPMKF